MNEVVRVTVTKYQKRPRNDNQTKCDQVQLRRKIVLLRIQKYEIILRMIHFGEPLVYIMQSM